MFNQAQALSLLVAALFFVAATAARGLYTRVLSADSTTAALAADYPRWFVPALALQFGVVSMGAALATRIAVSIGAVWLLFYFVPNDAFLEFRPVDGKPRSAEWAALLKVGLPAGAEFALMAVYLLVVYCGAAAQAGSGSASASSRRASCRWWRWDSRGRRWLDRTLARARWPACARP